ncbi:zinc ribbon domain-containing protein [Chloracidobacterium validum]|uniref:Zinc ribbon domain-containing protein n=1 Tax=Chloracidobacterium validum TaxID=2821543 RepID=A0ABX8B4S3_9BACT|nr:zinc ribbon domain-containing protein [Chloracidobacterium validum]QUW01973.1 zinc ribbon domain-containing protein [Chloracidobacterium validum]
MKIICPECQTEAAPGMKFCRNCGEKLPENGTPSDSAATVIGTALPPPDSVQTVVNAAVAPPKPPPDALKTVVGQAITPPNPSPDALKTVVGQAVMPPKPSPDALKTVVGQAVTPPKPSPDALKTVVGQAVTPPTPAPEALKAVGGASAPSSLGEAPQAVRPTPESTSVAHGEDSADRSGNRFVYFILVLAVLGFLAGLAIFLTVYVFGEKPNPVPAATKIGTEILDSSITRLELCSFRTLPNEPDSFDAQTVANTFPPGIRAVAVRVTGQPPVNGDYRIVWRRLESPAPLMAQSIQSFTDTQQAVRLLYQPDGKPLPAGNYAVEIQDSDRPLARAYFTIGSAANQPT